MIPLKEHYKTTVVPELKEKLGLNSVMAVPKYGGWRSFKLQKNLRKSR